MKMIVKKLCGKISDHRKHETNPFDPISENIQVHPKLFAILPKLPTASRDLLNYIVNNAQDGRVVLEDVITPDTSVKSKPLFRAGVIELLNWKIIARAEKKTAYWINTEIINPAPPKK